METNLFNIGKNSQQQAKAKPCVYCKLLRVDLIAGMCSKCYNQRYGNLI